MSPNLASLNKNQSILLCLLPTHLLLLARSLFLYILTNHVQIACRQYYGSSLYPVPSAHFTTLPLFWGFVDRFSFLTEYSEESAESPSRVKEISQGRAFDLKKSKRYPDIYNFITLSSSFFFKNRDLFSTINHDYFIIDGQALIAK